jgi:hypothetical protein
VTFELAEPTSDARPFCTCQACEILDRTCFSVDFQITPGMRADRQHAHPETLCRPTTERQLLIVFKIVPIPPGRRVLRQRRLPWFRVRSRRGLYLSPAIPISWLGWSCFTLPLKGVTGPEPRLFRGAGARHLRTGKISTQEKAGVNPLIFCVVSGDVDNFTKTVLGFAFWR